jgi:hypothetical protein
MVNTANEHLIRTPEGTVGEHSSPGNDPARFRG